MSQQFTLNNPGIDQASEQVFQFLISHKVPNRIAIQNRLVMEEVLLKFKAKQTENQKLMGAYYFNSDYVCTMPDGRVIAPNYIERVFHSTITKSNLPQVTLHLLRHSVASNLLNDGFSVTQVQEWLGHSSAATTLTFYAHVDKTSKLQIANQLDKIDAENGFIQLESDKKSASEKPKKIKGSLKNVGVPLTGNSVSGTLFLYKKRTKETRFNVELSNHK